MKPRRRGLAEFRAGPDAGPLTVVDAAGAPVAYRDSGGPGRPAVFLHGLGTSHRLWAPTVEALAGRKRCVAIDLPCHGGTPAPPGRELTLPAIAVLVNDTLDALGIDEIDLVGNDTGGALALLLAANQPGRVATLSLTNCDTPGNYPPLAFRPTVWAARAGLLAPLGRIYATHPRLARRIVYRTGLEHPGAMPLGLVEELLAPVFGTRERARDFQALVASLGPSDLDGVLEALRRYAIPTLLVWGEADRTFGPRWAHELARHLPDVTTTLVPDARLFFPLERGTELAQHLARHWSRHEPCPEGRRATNDAPPR